MYFLRFLLDENVPLAVRNVFERLGHEAKHLSLERHRGSPDEEVVELAISEGRMLVTKTWILDASSSSIGGVNWASSCCVSPDSRWQGWKSG